MPPPAVSSCGARRATVYSTSVVCCAISSIASPECRTQSARQAPSIRGGAIRPAGSISRSSRPSASGARASSGGQRNVVLSRTPLSRSRVISPGETGRHAFRPDRRRRIDGDDDTRRFLHQAIDGLLPSFAAAIHA